jgi:CVNH domain
MKLLYSSLLSILAASMINGVQGACFSATCTGITLASDYSLEALCDTGYGGSINTKLNLNLCFWNDNGVLKAGNG